MKQQKSLLIAYAAVFGAMSLFAAARNPIVFQDKSLGLNLPPPDRSAWHSRMMDFPRRYTESDCRFRPGEFLELEYGSPVASFSFTNGFTRLWGASKNDLDLPGIRFGRGWGDYTMCQWALVADVEQDSELSEWEFWRYRGKHSERKRISFRTPGGKRKTFFMHMGMIRPDALFNGMRLTCTTNTPAKGKIHSLKVVCYEIPATYRRRFTLDAKPAFAGISAPMHPHSRIVVNGKTAAEGVIVRNKFGLMRKDISEHLRPGENEVRYAFDAGAGWAPGETQAAIELFTVDGAGRTTHLGGDAKWECRFGDGEWTPVKLGGNPGVARQGNGNEYAAGDVPLHAGPLQVSPHGEKYPVFDCDGKVEWTLWYPDGMRRPSVGATVKDAFSGAVVETLDANATKTAAFKVRKTGAYEIEWKLMSDGKAVDSCTTEMVIAGPLEAEEFSLGQVEEELQKRKRLIHEIDPTDSRWFSVSSNFIAHSGMYVKQSVDMGKCVKEAGRTVRETGDSDGSYFCWSIPVGTLGNAHLVEIDYPDTREQVVYSAVLETYPCGFCNNGPPFGCAQPNASGAVKTGDREPLSGKMRTLRYVFFPGSRNSTVTFESGLAGKPAACAAIRIYEIDGGLPAWKRPQSDRLFLNHNERILFGIWGAWRTPMVYSSAAWVPYRSRLWSGAFAATRNRISQLRFEGHNAAIEGVYMYQNGFPSMGGESNACEDSFDFAYLVAKMYRHNGIRFFAGFEYLASPRLSRLGAYDVSERDLWKGGGASPAHHVDKNGRLAVGFGGMGYNDRHPAVRASITNLVSEIYRRYDGLDVAGMFLVSGGWWLPGFTSQTGQTPGDIGFDDASVAEFERDTGIALGTGVTGRERFAKRHALLTGRYGAEWSRWRATRMRNAFAEIQDIIRGGRDRWGLLVLPTGVRYGESNPFHDAASAPYMRDTEHFRLMGESALDPLHYGVGSGDAVRMAASATYGKTRDYGWFGVKTGKGVRSLIRRNDVAYFSSKGLNERPNSTKALGDLPWWWTVSHATVYEVKFSGDAAYSDFVEVLSDHTPQTLIHTWTDCNCNTAHDAALREFLSGYYATPAGEGRPYERASGVTAHIYGGKLQLVNGTPYPLSGIVDGYGDVNLKPYAVRVFDRPGECRFRFAGDVERKILKDAQDALSNEAVASRIRPECVAALRMAVETKDGYAACRALRDWEVGAVLRRADSSQTQCERQRRFESMLEKDGVARIDCGSTVDITDESGRTWLADQVYTGFGAYGHTFANVVDRGPIPISNTGTPSIYRTEAGCSGRLFYRVHVPKGQYRVVLHFAETWDELPGRVMDVTVGGETKTVAPWDAGGRYAASSVAWEGVVPTDGAIDVSIVRGPPILNGMEFYRVSR